MNFSLFQKFNRAPNDVIGVQKVIGSTNTEPSFQNETSNLATSTFLEVITDLLAFFFYAIKNIQMTVTRKAKIIDVLFGTLLYKKNPKG